MDNLLIGNFNTGKAAPPTGGLKKRVVNADYLLYVLIAIIAASAAAIASVLALVARYKRREQKSKAQLIVEDHLRT
ncbi:MAG: hypothetical protein NWE98_07125 [Candidatus Bathyarchaeota archaeon]|nr:hypothetical protein [Candidatus Bathyarchaeota archaeon]